MELHRRPFEASGIRTRRPEARRLALQPEELRGFPARKTATMTNDFDNLRGGEGVGDTTFRAGRRFPWRGGRRPIQFYAVVAAGSVMGVQRGMRIEARLLPQLCTSPPP